MSPSNDHSSPAKDEPAADGASSTGPSASSRSSESRPRRRRVLWLMGGIATVLVLVLILVVLLPTLLSTSPGNRTLLGWLNRQIAGHVEAETIRVGWLEGPRARNLRLLDPQGRLVADVPSMAAPEARPLSIVFGSRDFGDVGVQASMLHVRQQRGEPTNLQLALASPTPEEPEEEPGPARVDEDLSTRVQFSAESITYEGPDIEPVELTEVEAALDLRDIQAIGLDVTSNLRHDEAPGRIEAHVQLSDMFTQAGELQWRAGGVLAEMDVENLPLDAVDRLMQMDGRLAALLGPQLDAQVRTEGPVDAMTATVSARSEHLTVEAQLDSDERSVTTPGATLALNVTPAAFARWTQIMEGEPQPELLEPFTAELRLASLTVPRRDDTLVLEEGTIEATGTLGDIRLRVPQPAADTEDPAAPQEAQGSQAEAIEVGLHDTRLSLSSEALNELIEGQWQAEASYADMREPMQATLAVRGALGEAVERSLALEAEALPVTLADALVGLEGRLTETLGPTLSMRLQAAQPAPEQLTFSGELEAAQLTGSVQGQWDAEREEGELTTPTPLELTLTPAAFEAWMGELGPQIALVEPMSATLDLAIPRLGLREVPEDVSADMLSRIDPQRTTLAAELMSPRVVVQDRKTQGRAALDEVRINIPAGSLDQVLELLIEMRVEDLAGDAPPQPQPQTQNPNEAQDTAAPGTLESRTQVHDLVGPAGTLDPAGARLVSDFTATRIASSVVDMLAQQEGQLAAVLGPHTSASAHVDYQRQRGGSASIDLASTNASGQLVTAIDPDGLAHLTEDATLSVQVTDAVSDVMLRRFNPLLGHVVTAAAPIDLRLYAQGSSVPLDPFVWERLNIDGQLNMPQFTLRAAGFLQAAFQAMRAFGGLPAASEYQARLTPAEFAIRQGVLSYEDFAIELASDMNLLFAGTVNLDTQALNLDMTFAGDAYPREMRGLTVPLEGTVDDPELDEGRLTELLVRRGIQRGLEGLLPGRDDPPPEDEPEEDEPEEEPERERRSPLEELFERIR